MNTKTIQERANNTARNYAGCSICNNSCDNNCRLYRLVYAAFIAGYNSCDKDFKQAMKGEE